MKFFRSPFILVFVGLLNIQVLLIVAYEAEDVGRYMVNNHYSQYDQTDDDDHDISQVGYATSSKSLKPPEKNKAMKRYFGYSVLRTKPKTQQQLKRLFEIAKNPGQGLNFWQSPSHINRTVDIMVSPDRFANLTKFLDLLNLHWNETIADVGKDLIKGQSDQTLRRAYHSDGAESFYDRYQTFSNIEKHLFQLKSKYEDLMTISKAGESYEKRPLYLIKLSLGSMASLKNKNRRKVKKKSQSSSRSIIWLDAGHHAREWVSHATCIYIIENLLKDYQAGSREVVDIFHKYDIYVMPVVNPDGYVFSHTNDRMWRKTRSKQGRGCYGVDPNRNYPTNWGYESTNNDPCAEDYAGTEALSEPETRTLSEVLLKHKDRIKMYLSLHAYSQLLLTPWGHRQQKPAHYDLLQSLGQVTLEALKSVHGTNYGLGVSSIILYPAPGGSDDFAMGEAGVKYSYTLELRDQGKHGFNLPVKYIIPTAKETYVGIIAGISELIKRKEY